MVPNWTTLGAKELNRLASLPGDELDHPSQVTDATTSEDDNNDIKPPSGSAQKSDDTCNVDYLSTCLMQFLPVLFNKTATSDDVCM